MKDDFLKTEAEKSALKSLYSSFDNILMNVEGSILIFGAGELSRFLLYLCAERKIKVLAILDDYFGKETFEGVRVLKTDNAESSLKKETVLLGTLCAEGRMKQRLTGFGFTGKILSLKDPFSHLLPKNEIISDSGLIRSYKDIHKGKRCFIIGNGPSLLKTDPRRLMNEITIGCNNIFLLDGFCPAYYTAEDPVLAQDRAGKINALDWVKFFPSSLSGWLKNGIFIKTIPGTWPSDKFSTDLTKGIEINYTVTYAMMQLAYYLGCNPVYLTGVDHDYIIDDSQHCKRGEIFTSVKNDPNHFHPDYFGKGYRWHDPRVDRMEAAYRVAKEFFEKDGRTVFNATAGGKLEVFPRVDFEELVRK